MVLKAWVQQVLAQLCAFRVRYVWDLQTEHLSMFWVVSTGWCCFVHSPLQWPREFRLALCPPRC